MEFSFHLNGRVLHSFATIEGTPVENTQVGPFLIKSRLGTNRRQHVYKAVQVEQERDVALKFISLPPNVARAKALDKIDREVQFLQQLRHPNLAQLYGAGVHDEKIFFATELVDGESLTSIMTRRGKLAPDLAVDYASQICSLLQYIHQKDLLHAKLTPDKILVGKDGTVKVTDLRINRSRRKRWDAMTKRRELDLAAYMAPEQHTDGTTTKSDLYSLGVITYEMLTGKLPYEPDTMGRMTKRKKNEPVPSAAKLVMNCPVWLDKIVTQMLQPEPRSRPHTAKAVGMAFEEIKKIDQNKKAAIAQVSGNFNPLTAGSDKAEARRLLNKKRKKKKPTVPFYETVPFLAGCLILIAGIITIAVWPTSTKKMYAQGVELVNSEDPRDWSLGIGVMKKVISRDNDEFTERAEDQILVARRKSLIKRAQVGKKTAMQSKQEQLFIDAYRFEYDRNFSAAATAYQKVCDDFDGTESKQNYIRIEAMERLDRMQHFLALPDNPDLLIQLVDSVKELSDKAELLEARKKLVAIIERFDGDAMYNDAVEHAKVVTDDLDYHLRSLDESGTDTENDTNNKGESANDDPSSPIDSKSGESNAP